MHPVDNLVKLLKDLQKEVGTAPMNTATMETQLKDACDAFRGSGEGTVEYNDNEVLVKLDEYVFVQYLKVGTDLWKPNVRTDFIEKLRAEYDERDSLKKSDTFDDFIALVNSTKDNNHTAQLFILSLLDETHKGNKVLGICEITYKVNQLFTVVAPSGTTVLKLQRKTNKHWEASSD